jgi:hypothetical protein
MPSSHTSDYGGIQAVALRVKQNGLIDDEFLSAILLKFERNGRRLIVNSISDPLQYSETI